jgi:hypothetical protein
MKLRLEIIYKRKQSTKQGRLGFADRQSILSKREAQVLYSTSDRVAKE